LYHQRRKLLLHRAGSGEHLGNGFVCFWADDNGVDAGLA